MTWEQLKDERRRKRRERKIEKRAFLNNLAEIVPLETKQMTN